MKCTHCGSELDPGHVFAIAYFTPTPHVANIHPHCMVELLGRSPARALANLCLTAGWTQSLLPGMSTANPARVR